MVADDFLVWLPLISVFHYREDSEIAEWDNLMEDEELYWSHCGEMYMITAAQKMKRKRKKTTILTVSLLYKPKQPRKLISRQDLKHVNDPQACVDVTTASAKGNLKLALLGQHDETSSERQARVNGTRAKERRRRKPMTPTNQSLHLSVKVVKQTSLSYSALHRVNTPLTSCQWLG